MKEKIQRDPFKQLFGSLKHIKLDAQKIKDNIRAEEARRDRKLQNLLKK